MKISIFIVFIVWGLFISVTDSLSQRTSRSFHFYENKGQITDQNFNPRNDVLFGSNRQGLQIFLRADGMHYQLSTNQEESTGFYRADINWLGANSDIKIIKSGQSVDYDNYYNVGENTAPALYVKNYESITYENIYDNIDLYFYSSPDGNMKYDFVVKPDAEPKNIRIEINGATLQVSDANELVIKTPFGDIIEGALKAYQNNKEISCKWVLENNILSFDIANYDPTLPLVIDPPVRLWGTYYGGSSGELVSSVNVDDTGNMYMTGSTGATSNIATVGAHQQVFGGDNFDAFLVKMDSLGNRLWCTYYGGSNKDYGLSCKNDNLNNIFLVGKTRSANNIATANTHQSSLSGYYDAFIAKFDSNGIRIWGTYYGGSQVDDANACALDNNGNIFITGITESTDLISDTGAHQHIYGGGWRDAYIAKLDNSGTLLWDTYYGGSLDDLAYSCATDYMGNIYITGKTSSLNEISSYGTHQDSLGGNNDAFLVKFNSDGIRQWGTYYGGNNSDFGTSCATDINNNIFLAGYTTSTDKIATTGAYQTSMGGLDWDGFLVKFNTNGVRQWGTYYGGEDLDHGEACATDILGNVYLAGSTKSKYNITSPGAYLETYYGGSYDAYLAKFDTDGNRYWGTYYGGEKDDYGYAVATYGTDIVYLAGHTYSDSNIASVGAHQTNHFTGGGGSSDGFVVKFSNDTTAHLTSPDAISVFDFLAYPSPGNGFLTIEFNKVYLNLSIKVFNILGKLILNELISSAQILSLELPHVPGLYFLEISSGHTRTVKKIVIKN